MKDFKQVLISPSLGIFGEKFMKKWDLKPYHDPHAPTVVLGMHQRPGHHEKFKNHKAEKWICFGGRGDWDKPGTLELVKSTPNCKAIAGTKTLQDKLNQHGIQYLSSYLAYKDFDNYNPIKLGNKIYIYIGIPSLHRSPNYRPRYEKFALPLFNHFGKDKFVFIEGQMLTKEQLNNLYRQCFLYIKPNDTTGCTSMFELGHMGVRTITAGHEYLPCAIDVKYKENLKYTWLNGGLMDLTIDENLQMMVKLIEDEKSRIGTTQPQVAEETKKAILQTDEWMALDFWHKIN